ncbi:MAG TPA: universal stress protein [Tepidisphaeraceae bacterium]|jgi:nucleotide-binding universal stress UspA family protein
MYKRILVTLDATDADQTILSHIIPLAKMFRSGIILLHVADGWAARMYGADAVSPEVTEDRAYLAKIKSQLEAEGLAAETELAYGEPATEIVRWVRREHCDLIAMTTHGHRFLADLFLGKTAVHVQHQVDVPILLVRVKA